MSESDAKDRDRCVLALVPTSKDASVTRKLLSSNGILLEICPTFDALIQELRRGAAAILLPEEAVSVAHNTTLRGHSGGTTPVVRSSRAHPDQEWS